MKYADVAENMKRLLDKRPSNDEFVYELLLAYGTPKATVARLKKGQLNLAQEPGEVLLKKKLWFKTVSSDLFDAMEDLKSDKATKTNDPRFLIVTDFEHMLAVDRKTDDTLDVELSELETHFDFFLPWAGMEKTKLSNENPADVKAAEKMAKLFDVIKQDNLDYVRDNPHEMNIFLSRLLFCLYAEDTGIFPKNAVCNAIASYTAVDGTDLPEFFTTLFNWLDKSDHARSNIQHQNNSANGEGHSGIRELPYVNGGLFKDHYPVPKFSAKSRRMIIESGTLNWSEINPDIFGSMFQAVIDPAERHNLGQHYTSVTNIMKVIEPLFLNDFKAELEKAREMTRGKMQALNRLLDRIANVKIFDPACGSGNFLIIAYKELRRLEIAVFQELEKIEPQLILSRMSVSQFYGIEIADFACETAILALWLAQHQMNVESRRVIGKAPVSLPLKESANVVCGNACRLDWESVCPKNEGDEIYIMGNPPYLGSSMQNKEQKADMDHVFRGINNYKNLDYIACWFIKGSEYIQENKSQYAFVSTNSICQGEQVALLWPHIFNKGLEIGFAHQSFKWTNNAKGNAGVTCVIIGVRNKNNEASTIFRHGVAQSVKVINAYLTAGSEVIVQKRSVPLSRIPKMSYGNKPVDGGHLILSDAEKESLLAAFPEARKFVRKLLGADEFINGISRWCLWIADDEVDEASNIPPIRERIEKVKAMRLASRDQSANEMAKTAHRFREQKCSKKSTIIIPAHTSENRRYIPFGFLDSSVAITNAAQVIYDPETWVFGIISSVMHMTWVRATCGMLETRIRYSSSLCYNTFPIPDLAEAQKQMITLHVGEVLSEREKHSEKTMAQLYDPDKMPAGLREAHHQLDLAVDRLYRSKPFTSDEERLEHLFKLYEEMVAGERLV
jgi:type I restriction-modification system DNA methylase subunit